MRDPEKISHQQVAEAGEHYALYRLYVLGYVGGQAPRGMAETDLLVMRPDGTNVATVQVKTRSSEPPDGGWHMQVKHEEIARENLFYVFIGLETDPPLCYVIPSRVVADVIRLSHSVWLSTPGRGGRPHKNSKVRRLCPDYRATLCPVTRPTGLSNTATLGTCSTRRSLHDRLAGVTRATRKAVRKWLD